MNKKHLLLAALMLSPALSFATTGDATFSDVTTQLKTYLGGSLGLVFVFVGFIGAGAAMAGFAPMKVMFPVFGLTLAMHYGPKILEDIFGATGDGYSSAAQVSSAAELVMMLATVTLLAFAVKKHHKTRNLLNTPSVN